MRKILGAWLFVAMLFLVACTSENSDKPSPTIPPTRVIFVDTATPSPIPTRVLFITPSPTHFNGILPTLSATESTIPHENYSISGQISSFVRWLMTQPHPTSVNGLPSHEFILMPPTVIEHVREIYAEGQVLGRNPNAFSRTGDSTIERPNFLYRFDEGEYHLGAYAYLQPVIAHYAGSFGHDSVAVRRGLNTWGVLDPMWATAPCESGENMLACEIRTFNPSIFIIRLGSNDRGADDLTAESLREIVEYCIAQGVIPILGTKADRFEGSNHTNEVLRALAEEYQVPLWDFDLVANTIDGRGLGRDNVHLSFFLEHDWRLPQGLTTGHGLHNLTALMMLDAVWQVLNAP